MRERCVAVNAAGRRVMAVFAHPDDETLLAGGLLARGCSEGARVALLGVAGGDDDRRESMRHAAAVLGIEHTESLRYLETTVAETESRSLAPASAPRDDLVTQILGRFEEWNPDTVLTHSSAGDYGHGDHIAVHEATSAAFERFSPSGNNGRLYQLAWPAFLFRLNRVLSRFSGMNRRDSTQSSLDHQRRQTVGGRVMKINVRRHLKTRKLAARHYRDVIARGPLAWRLLESAPVLIQSTVLGTARIAAVRNEGD